jgi:hypothetical protein
MRKKSVYKVTHNERFNNFLISPKFIFEESLNFVYTDNGNTIEKVIPLKKIGPYLKTRKFFKYDSDVDRFDYNGWAYEVPASVIFLFNKYE